MPAGAEFIRLSISHCSSGEMGRQYQAAALAIFVNLKLINS